MVNVPMPLISAPGRKPQASGGRLINVMVEKLGDTAGSKLIYWRVPGLKAFGTTTETNFRGAILVGSTAYVIMGDTAFTFTSGGGAGSSLSGTVPGDVPVFLARNNAATPDIVMVVPGDGAFVISGGAVAAYPDLDVGIPNSVVFHKGFFVFTYGDGTTRTSGVNSTSINTLDVATAESKPDPLLRGMPLGNGQLLLCGTTSIEVWGDGEDVGYPFSYIATIPRGLAGRYSIVGNEDGWGKGIFLIGDDNRVSRLNAYQPEAISTPDLDDLITAEADKNDLIISVYMARGHAFVVVQSATWCWEYDVDLGAWHERQSHLSTFWRGRLPFNAFGKWLCGDTESGNIIELDGNTQKEIDNPLRMRIETGPLGAFPQALRVSSIELYLTKGAGNITGSDPDETDPEVGIAMSKNGGQDWMTGRNVKVGRQSLTLGRVRSNIWGTADVQGVRWRFDFSSGVPFGFMGADMKASELR